VFQDRASTPNTGFIDNLAVMTASGGDVPGDLLGHFEAAAEDAGYRGQHQGPDADSGEAMHEVGTKGTYPADIHEHPDWYIANDGPGSWDSYDKVRRSRDWPSRRVTMYRSLPSPHRSVSPGDWVSSSAEYARDHGRQSNPEDDWPVVRFEARADQLRTDGNSINEWSYHGPPVRRALVHFSGGKNHRGKGPRGGKSDAAVGDHEPPEMNAEYNRQNAERRQRLRAERASGQPGVTASAAEPREELPPDPGTAPIPRGHVRLWHYTPLENVPSIRQRGLLREYARGDAGDRNLDDPSAGVWASTKRPDDILANHSEGRAVVEFHAHPGEISGQAEEPWQAMNRDRTWDDAKVQDWASGYHHVIMRGDVPPRQIVAVHEPWHGAARYMRDDPAGTGSYQWVRDDYARGGNDHLEPYVRGLRALEGSVKGGAVSAVAARYEPGLPNPHTGGGEWFHGTHGRPEDFMHGFSYPEHHDHEDEELRGHLSHWNTFLGAHFAADHGVAEHFAQQGASSGEDDSEYGPEPETRYREAEPQSVVHARLHLHNPKVYGSEHDMDNEAYEHEARAGNWIANHFREGYEDEDPHSEDYDPDTTSDGEEWPLTARFRHDDKQPLIGKDERPIQGLFAASHPGQRKRAQWLASHPDKDGIARRFRERLQAQGHDGILYGNELEADHAEDPGEHHALSAVVFHPGQAEITQHHAAGHPCMGRDEAEMQRRRMPQAGQEELPGVEDHADRFPGGYLDGRRPPVVAHFAEPGSPVRPGFQQKLFHAQPDPTLNTLDSGRHNPEDPLKRVRHRQETEEAYVPPVQTWDHPEYGNQDDEGRYRHPGHGGYLCHACTAHEGEATFHDDPEESERHETTHTDWDEEYPRIPATVHRGMRIDDDGSQGRHHMHMLRGVPAGESAARTVLHHLGDFGTHWTGNEQQARHYADVGTGGYRTPGDHDMNVVVHARKPDREDIETDPETLADQNVFGMGYHDDEEIPLREGTPVHVSGVSWKFHDEPESAWRRHDFGEHPEHTAAVGPPPEENEEQSNYTLHPEAACPHCGEPAFGEKGAEALRFTLGDPEGTPVPSSVARCRNCGETYPAHQSGEQARVDREAAEMNHAEYERSRAAGGDLFSHFTDSPTHPVIGWDGARDLVSQWHRDEHQFTGPGRVQMPQDSPMARQIREHRFNRVLTDPAASRPVELPAPGGDITRLSAAGLPTAEGPRVPSFTWRHQTYGQGPEGGYVDAEQEVSGPFYHGSRSKRLQPGSMIRKGMPTNPWGDEGPRSQRVHFTTSLAGARTYARDAGGHVYEVEPTGDVTMGYNGDEWKSEHPLRVIRRVPDDEEGTQVTAAVVAHFEERGEHQPPGHFDFYRGLDRENTQPRLNSLEEHLTGFHAGSGGVRRGLQEVRDSVPWDHPHHDRQLYAGMDALHRRVHEQEDERARSAEQHGAPAGWADHKRMLSDTAHHPEWQAENEERQAHDDAVAEHRENGSAHFHGRSVDFADAERHLREDHGFPQHAMPEYELPTYTHGHDPYAQALEEAHEQHHGEHTLPDTGSYRHTPHGQYVTMHWGPRTDFDAEHHLVEHHGYDINELRHDEPDLEAEHERDHEQNRRYLDHHLYTVMDPEGHLPGHQGYQGPDAEELREGDPEHHFEVHSHDDEGGQHTRVYHAEDEDHAQDMHEEEHPDEEVHGVNRAPVVPPRRQYTMPAGHPQWEPQMGFQQPPNEHGVDAGTAATWQHVPYAAPPRSREELEEHIRTQHGSSSAGYGGSPSELHASMHDSEWAEHQHDYPEGHDPVFGSHPVVSHFAAPRAALIPVYDVAPPPALGAAADVRDLLAAWEPEEPGDAAGMARALPYLFLALRDGLAAMSEMLSEMPLHPAVRDAVHDLAAQASRAAQDAEDLVRRLPPEASCEDHRPNR